MNNQLKEEIRYKYKNYLTKNYNEKYIYQLIIQEGYNREDVDVVMKDIYADKQKALKEKNKYRSIISIILYVAGTVVLSAGIVMIVLGGIKIGIALIILAVMIWINANK
ncbi:hypothetical protein EG347_04480 [Chryseobacterium sp. G0186]|uniref:hypothetical protein n=1 Tax=Chryseobacterium sp. G0186 TaxID=2487064 RepID=UPI000F4FAD14|nr:hypothetical protein [Chryseobacterium sp. G0186]AZA76824.1 hypothetical protein EG347_04480 [Chryseobacterium sp. G0186]